MKIDKLLKRFMKEIGIYGAAVSKDVLLYLDDYDEAMLPFNAFRWDTSKQGHNYWYQISMDWVIYLHDNFNCIDNEDKSEYGITELTIKDGLLELLKFYCLDNSDKNELLKMNSYNKANKLYNELMTKKN